ncbi:unnamed protein product [Prorocentrum cordatum]|uniref:Uncharacterized protein n=1 Tax=Prorocentrum cordatum TaxID=2364126 RepID=A0ABN9YDU1_9DINO|nr:unnamed protein product [Polarella glacialis]
MASGDHQVFSTNERTHVKKLGLRNQAAQITAMNALYSHSSTGSLQHDHLRRLQRALDSADEAGRTAGASPVHHLDVKGRLAQDPIVGAPRQVRKSRQNESTEPQWRLQRGKWVYDDGERYVPPGWDGLSSAEASAQFWEDEQAKKKAKPYRNGVAIEGRMRGWQRRNPSGGFFSEL